MSQEITRDDWVKTLTTFEELKKNALGIYGNFARTKRTSRISAEKNSKT